MKKLVLGLLSCVVSVVFASGDGIQLQHANVQPDNFVSLQNGAKLYVNYCLGCHSLEFQRYERLAKDLQLPNDLVAKNLMFTGEKIGDQMTIAMKKDDAAKWFGAPPPDLSLVSRSRGTDWIYTYLKSFYKDEKRPYGVNNTVFPSVGMPHVLQPLQGLQARTDEHGFELVQDGSMTPDEYDSAVRDIANFLQYVGEPVKQERKVMGIYAMIFLLVFFIFAYMLKKEYWKDVYPDGH